MNILEAINTLIKEQLKFEQMAAEKRIYKAYAKDIYNDNALCISQNVENLCDIFELKLCQSCGFAYEIEHNDQSRCGGCESKKQAIKDTERALDDNRNQGNGGY